MSLAALIRRHPAIRRLPHWLLAALVGANLLLGILAWTANARDMSYSADYLLTFTWLIMGFFFIGGGDRWRCQVVDLALPIPARRLWLGHVLAVLTVGLAELVLIVALLLGIHSLVRSFGEDGLIALLPIDGLLLLPAALLALAGWREWRAGGGVERAGGRRAGLVALVEILVLAGAILLLSRLPWGGSLLLIPAALFFALAARSLPPALRLLPREASTAAAAVAAPFEVSRSSAPPSLLWSTVLRVSAKNHVALAAGWGFLILFGMILGGLFPDYASLRVPMLPIVVYMLFALTAKPLLKLAPFDAWPLPRERLLAIVVLPALALLALGYGLGQLSDRLRAPAPEAFRVSVVDEGDQLVVPVRLCEIAWGGAPPSATAPWGETQPAWSAKLLRGTTPRIYSPFTAPAGSSPEFFAWQLSRAIRARYDAEIGAAALQERYLSEDEAGHLRVREGGLTVAADFGLAGPRERTSWFPLVVGLPAVLTLLLLAGYLREFRPGRTERRRKVAFVVILAVLILFHLGVFALFIAGLTEDFIAGGLFAIAMRHAAAAWPIANALLWLAVAALGWGAWRVALVALRRAELASGRGCL